MVKLQLPRSVPDEFYWKDNYGNIIGQAPDFDNYYTIFQDVLSYKIELSDTQYWVLTTHGPDYSFLQQKKTITRDVLHLGPNYQLSIWFWLSVGPNKDPLGKIKLGQIWDPPLVIKLNEDLYKIDIVTKKLNRKTKNKEKFFLPNGEYYLNFWYVGHNAKNYFRMNLEKQNV